MGDAVFNFVVIRCALMIESLLKKAKVDKDDVDYYMFHQPNRFILQKVADKIGVSREKMPSNVVENYGNSSGVTIPVAITHNLGSSLEEKKFKICLSGFGVGLTWASILIEIGPLNFCEIIEF